MQKQYVTHWLIFANVVINKLFESFWGKKLFESIWRRKSYQCLHWMLIDRNEKLFLSLVQTSKGVLNLKNNTLTLGEHLQRQQKPLEQLIDLGNNLNQCCVVWYCWGTYVGRCDAVGMCPRYETRTAGKTQRPLYMKRTYTVW